jgi:cell division protein FtsL
MWRLLHVFAIGALLGSAGYVYEVKYRSVFAREQLVEVRRDIDKEQEQIALLKAEYASLTRPDRLEGLADKQLGMESLQLNEIAKIDDLPFAGPKVDAIGRKLETLDMIGQSTTPSAAASGTTPPVR